VIEAKTVLSKNLDQNMLRNIVLFFKNATEEHNPDMCTGFGGALTHFAII